VDPSTGQRGLLQRAIETGSRPKASSGADIGIPVRLAVEFRLGSIRKMFWDGIGLGGR
jgi:hypothetical protein